MQSIIFNTRWQYQDIAKMLLLVILISFSWLWAPSHTFWDFLDLETFAWLNHPMANHPVLALFWAVLNMRPIDLVFGFILFSLLLRGNWTVPVTQVRSALIGFVCLLVWMLIIRITFSHIIHTDFAWTRASPTLVLSDAVKLTDIFPGWDKQYHMKDDSPVSFPGDHASVLLIWAMFIAHFVHGYKRWLVWGLAILLSIPRLAAGAHWLTDDIVGGLDVSIIAYATAMYTPLLALLGGLLEDLLTPLLRLLKHLPILKSLSLFHDLE
jgi:membrane-associated phospholipid phosphatase